MRKVEKITLNRSSHVLPIYAVRCRSQKVLQGNYCTFSASTTTMRRPRISWSDNLENRTRAHLLWIGSMIFDDVLQARAKRVEFEYISIVLLKACCAPDVMLKYIHIRYLIQNTSKKNSATVSYNSTYKLKIRRCSQCILTKHKYTR